MYNWNHFVAKGAASATSSIELVAIVLSVKMVPSSWAAAIKYTVSFRKINTTIQLKQRPPLKHSYYYIVVYWGRLNLLKPMCIPYNRHFYV